MDPKLQQQLDLWFKYDRNPVTVAEMRKYVDANDTATLHQLLMQRMEFGTAGLRAAMGAGFSRMNDLTIVQTAQGLATYLQTQFSAEDLAKRGITIGYDARYNSKRFAQLSANVFVNAKIKTRMFRQIVATPFVPFAVKKYDCCAGVVVTASHNPKQDNGYKVYWNNGAQIISPHDEGIARCIEENLVPLDSSWEDVASEAFTDPFDEVHQDFFTTLSQEALYKSVCASSDLKFTYTAMHGVGTEFTLKALETFCIYPTRVVKVTEQVDPDPEFPTVAFPNPEEGKSALDLAIQHSEKAGSTIILANDPDADRLAVAEKTPSGWKVFTGNELGALFGWWCLHCAKTNGEDPKKLCMISSTVSSRILCTMAKKEGFHFVDTLTGFKWMASTAQSINKEGKYKVILAFEEAIGFMIGSRVYDKDGVTAAAKMAEMACFLRTHFNRTLVQQLDEVYKQYGYHVSYNSYVISKDSQQTNQMFADIRADGKYPEVVGGQKVLALRDLGTGYDSSTPDNKATLPTSMASQLITFQLANGVTLTVRSSGTEPKVKWYAEIVAETPQADVLHATVDSAVQQLMQPDKYGFEKRKAA